MTTKRVAENGVMHPGWDGRNRPAVQVSNTLPDVQVTDEQRTAARRYLARVAAVDIAVMLGLTDLEDSETTP